MTDREGRKVRFTKVDRRAMAENPGAAARRAARALGAPAGSDFFAGNIGGGSFGSASGGEFFDDVDLFADALADAGDVYGDAEVAGFTGFVGAVSG